MSNEWLKKPVVIQWYRKNKVKLRCYIQHCCPELCLSVNTSPPCYLTFTTWSQNTESSWASWDVPEDEGERCIHTTTVHSGGGQNSLFIYWLHIAGLQPWTGSQSASVYSTSDSTWRSNVRVQPQTCWPGRRQPHGTTSTQGSRRLLVMNI